MGIQPDRPDPLVGTLFAGRWLVERPLSAGGMGCVYVAAHTNTGKRVALKVIKSDAAHDPELGARFLRESSALAALNHPNVVSFLDSGIENGNLYLVMELLAGRSLRDAMAEPVAWPRAVRIAADVCRGLAAVHKAGLVHRDLKPENVFLQEAEGHDEVVKLIDFGIVRLEEERVTKQTRTGAIVGTPGYISPEQLRGQPATPTSDVYAMGVMLYEMATGRSPFDANDVHALLVKQLIDPVPAPRTVAPQLPIQADDVVMRLMDRDALARVPTARDALALLTGASSVADVSVAADPTPGPVVAPRSLPPSAATETGTPAIPPPAIPPPVDTPPRRRSRGPVGALAVLGAIVVAVGALVVVGLPRAESTAGADTVPAASTASASPPSASVSPSTPAAPVFAPGSGPASEPAATTVTAAASATTATTQEGPAEPSRAPPPRPGASPAAKPRGSRPPPSPAPSPPLPEPVAASPPPAPEAPLPGETAASSSVSFGNLVGRELERAVRGPALAGAARGGAGAAPEVLLPWMPASLMRGVEAIGGSVTVTTRLIEFRSDGVALQGGPEVIKIEDVFDVERAKSLVGSNKARVVTRHGARIFILEDRERFLSAVRKALEQGHDVRLPVPRDAR